MPIKALIRDASFPEIGHLRKGGEKISDRQPGKDLDHFRFTSPDAEVVEAFKSVFGEKPRSLEVRLPFRTMDENFEAWMEEYTAGAIQHRCDGETCYGWRTPDGKWSTEPKPCPGKCKASGRLKVFIPGLQRAAFVTVLTTSKLDIINIGRSLKALEAINGTIAGIPLVLSRVEREISTPVTDKDGNDTGKRARRKKWMLQIEAGQEWAGLHLNASREAALLSASREPLMLTSSLVDDDGDEDANPNNQPEDVPAMIAAIKKAAKDCGLASTVPLCAELKKECDIELKGPTLQVALESLTKEKRAAALDHLQDKAIKIAEAKAAEAETAAEPVHEGEVI